MVHYVPSTIRIEAPYFVGGVIPGWGAAPIVHYMVDWTESQIREYCAKKGWKVEIV